MQLPLNITHEIVAHFLNVILLFIFTLHLSPILLIYVVFFYSSENINVNVKKSGKLFLFIYCKPPTSRKAAETLEFNN